MRKIHSYLLKVLFTLLPGVLTFFISGHFVLAQGASEGPGLGNFFYNSSEVFSPISIINSPEGHGSVAMVHGYMMVIYTSDNGGVATDGGIEFWDVSDPRNPQLVFQYDNDDTHGLREPHGFGFSNSYPKDYLMAQAVDGIQFWDLSDPGNITLANYMDLPGITKGNYKGAWWAFWQAPYVYVAGVESGLYVVDATDPENPQLIVPGPAVRPPPTIPSSH